MALALPRRTGKGLQASRIFCPTDCGDSTIQDKYDARPTLPSTLANDSRDTYGIKPREPNGQNRILVVQGANDKLEPADIDAAPRC